MVNTAIVNEDDFVIVGLNLKYFMQPFDEGHDVVLFIINSDHNRNLLLVSRGNGFVYLRLVHLYCPDAEIGSDSSKIPD